MKNISKTVLSLLLLCLLGAVGKGYGQEVEPGTVLWEYDPDVRPWKKAQYLSVDATGSVIAGVYSAADHTNIYKIDKNGQKIWSNRVALPLNSHISISSNDKIYFNLHNSLTALNANGGKDSELINKYYSNSEDQRPNTSEGGIYSVYGHFTINDKGLIYYTPIINQKSIIRGINTESGKIVWQSDDVDAPDGMRYGSIAIGKNNTLYAAAGIDPPMNVQRDKGGLYAFNLETGSSRFYVNLGTSMGSGLTIGSNGNILLYSENLDSITHPSPGSTQYNVSRNLHSINGKSGEKLWSAKIDGLRNWSVGVNETVYVSTWEKLLYAIGERNGEIIWKVNIGQSSSQSPIIADDGYLYISAYGGQVICIDSDDGRELWRKQFGTDHISLSLNNDGLLYVGASNGKISCIKTGSTGLADAPWPTDGQNAQRTYKAQLGMIHIKRYIVPISPYVDLGSNIDLKVKAKGEWPRTYQWQRNGVDIPGATKPSLTIENAASKDSGLYRVTITNKYGSVTSDEAVLKVVTPGSPQIFADGMEVVGSVVKGDKAEITLSTSFEGGSIFYTLDGSEPSFETTPYQSPFTVSKTTGIRAIAYKEDFSDIAEADPVFINIVPNYNLKVSVLGQGSVVKAPGPYMQDSVVKLKAVPKEGWRFSGWSGALNSSFEEGSVVMRTNKSTQALFEKIKVYNLKGLSYGGKIKGIKPKKQYLANTMEYKPGFFNTGITIKLNKSIKKHNMSDSYIKIFREQDVNIHPGAKLSPLFIKLAFIFQNPTTATKDDFNDVWPTAGNNIPPPYISYNSNTLINIGEVKHNDTLSNISLDSYLNRNPKPLEKVNNIKGVFIDVKTWPQPLNISHESVYKIVLRIKDVQWSWEPSLTSDYTAGTMVNLDVVSDDGSQFLGWSGDAKGTNAKITLSMDRDKTVEAVFGTELTTTATGKGKLILDPPNGPYPYGSKVKITPFPDAGYYLGVWGGKAFGLPKGPVEFEITEANPKITALFVPLKENRFTVTTLASKGGSVNSNPNSNAYVNGQQVTLTATPEPGYSFVGWTGDIASTANPLVTLADANKTVTAEFRRNIIAPVTLTINAENGMVTRTPSDELYEKGTSVELLAQPNPGYTFTGWAGALGGTASRTTLFLDGDKTVTANFKASYQLAAETRGPGSVLTTPSSATFIDGDEVILTASPAEGYGFVGWTGDLESTDQQTTLAMDSNKRVIAHFAQLGTLTTWTRGEGTITRTPDKQSYFPGAKVTLTAKPGDGFQFVSWDGQASGTSNPTTVTMDRAMSVAANFKDIKAPTVTIASPATQETGDETFTLLGTVTDNGKIKSLVWLWKGQEMGELALVDGKFELNDQKLAGGANAITVVATDRSGNEGKATVTLTWVADRSIRIAAAKEQQEGNRIEVPIEISSKGNVGGMGFVLNYDHSYLMDPVLTWSSAAGGSINLVNSEVAGELKGTFSLGGTSLPGGDQLIGTVSFRARSVPESLETVLGLQDLSISDSNGNKLTSGTDVVSGRARVLVRDITGDNNANDRLDVGDATRIQRLLVGLDRARAWDVSSNDLNGSGDLDPGDVVKVLRTVVGIDPQPKRNRVIAKMGGDDEAVETAMLAIKEKTASTVTVQVQLKDMASTIAGANFQLEYPAELLKLKDKSSHAPGEIVAGNAAAIWNVSPAQTDYTKQDGTLAMAVSSPEPWTVKDGVLAEISFDVQNGADLNNAVLSLSQVEVTPDGFDNRMLSGSSFNVGSGETDKPTEPSEVEIIGIENAPFGFSFNTEEGTRYEVQASNDLRKWQQLREVKGTGEVIKFVDFRKAFYQQQYYRVRVVE